MRRLLLGLLLVFWMAPDCRASESPTIYSCLSPENDAPEAALRLSLSSPSGGPVWRVTVSRQATDETLGEFEVRILSESSDFTVFAGMEMSITLYGTGEWGHRRAEPRIPSLEIDSNRWVCKAEP